MIPKKKYIFKKHDFEGVCTQKITFWFNLPRKMRQFCVLRAPLKSTILKKKLFLKKHGFEEKKISKSMILNEKVFVKSVILNKNFFVSSDFESKLFRRVRF